MAGESGRGQGFREASRGVAVFGPALSEERHVFVNTIGDSRPGRLCGLRLGRLNFARIGVRNAAAAKLLDVAWLATL